MAMFYLTILHVCVRKKEGERERREKESILTYKFNFFLQFQKFPLELKLN